LRSFRTWVLFDVSDHTLFIEFTDDDSSQRIISVGDDPPANVIRFGKRACRQGPDRGGKKFDH